MAAQNEGGSHVIAERVHQKSGARRETAAPISAASFENRETGLTASSLKRIALSNVPGSLSPHLGPKLDPNGCQSGQHQLHGA